MLSHNCLTCLTLIVSFSFGIISSCCRMGLGISRCGCHYRGVMIAPKAARIGLGMDDSGADFEKNHTDASLTMVVRYSNAHEKTWQLVPEKRRKEGGIVRLKFQTPQPEENCYPGAPRGEWWNFSITFASDSDGSIMFGGPLFGDTNEILGRILVKSTTLPDRPSVELSAAPAGTAVRPGDVSETLIEINTDRYYLQLSVVTLIHCID